MGDVAGTVIKLLSSLLSPKSSFKIILIAASIVLFWLYLQPELLKFNLPAELTSLVTLLVGVGIGSLVCDLFTVVFTKIYKACQSVHLKKVDAIQKEKEESRRLDQERAFVEQFQEAYEHYDLHMKQALRGLIKENKPYHDNVTVMSLHHNKTIVKVSRIDGSKTLYSINPLIASHVKEQWDNEINAGINDFLTVMSPLKNSCLELLELSESSFDGKVRKLKKSLFVNRHELNPVISTTFVSIEEPFYLYFQEGYLEALETRLSRQFTDEIEVILK